MCRHMCPVGHVTYLESLTPHGWGQLVASQRRGLIEWNESTVDVMYSCADCGVCQAHCVTDQPLPDAIAAVRANLVSDGLAPAAVAGLKERFERWGTAYAETTPEGARGTGETAIFVGDAAVHRASGTVEAVLKLLDAVHIRPALIGVGRNSGYLPASLGLVETAKKLAEQNIADARAAGARRVLVLAPADYYTFTALCPDRLDIAWPDDIEIEDVVSVLDRKRQEGTLSLRKAEVGVPYAYVDPTHAGST